MIEKLQSFEFNLKTKTRFGKGNSAEHFIEILEDKSFWEISCQKQFVDQQIKGEGN